MPSNFFDYLSSQKVILGFVPFGAQRDFLKDSNTVIICDPDNLEETVDLLFDLFMNGKTLHLNKNFLNKFHIQHFSKELSEVLKKLYQ